ncbi:Glycerophosphoryl diester phosphodiesterase [Penicillium expansum]|uniref:Glycerophosphoryl diester phosphodiesterase n=1 Tax=Penicillium expansum TaxID=27334 RepID=A0A0A2KP98_PENEN|nr:Glycerophosphoryl diester phosphodiesterase [Penicillium expansum]KGO38145.1 Glycerophosphoryl diester phosphodiesterase [Penicillium expansum]KGO61753.1 Glycerophosphoryl diester phosphodiesterase [Penicillium expansum]KGO66150.1 Glycerophosphoryl diester phosphodiesterase [Penicillium expansum]
MGDVSPIVPEEHSHAVKSTHSPQALFHHNPVAHSSPRLPHAIAHRGFKGQYPENTLLSIDGAIRAGAQALELDLHISRDGIVVLSHDASLMRCYGIKKKVIDCDWEYLQTLRTLQAPHEPMPRLVDVLEYLSQPGRENLWILLDIKLANEPFDIMQRIAKIVESVPLPANGPDWHHRIVLGCWSARYIPARAKHLPLYAVTLVCVDVSYARQFLQVPLISFNINQMILMGPLGRGFLDEARAARRQVYVWTVNAPNLMRWCIRHEIDGVISDEPGRFRQVCQGWEKEHTGVLGAPNPELDRIPFRQRIEIIAVALYVICFGWILKRMYLTPVERLGFEEHKSK